MMAMISANEFFMQTFVNKRGPSTVLCVFFINQLLGCFALPNSYSASTFADFVEKKSESSACDLL